MEIVSSFAQKLLNPELLKEQEPVKSVRKVGAPALMAAVTLAAPSVGASIETRNDPASSKPGVVSGYTLDPSENLIQNGDFNDFDLVGSSYYTFSHWTYNGSETTTYLFQGDVNYPRYDLRISRPRSDIQSTSVNPEFDINGILVNDVTFISEALPSWGQSVATQIGSTYILQFDLSGYHYSSRYELNVDGISGLLIDGYDIVFTHVPESGTTTYQFEFVAQSSETEISFLGFGYAQNYYPYDAVEGWDIPEGAYTVLPAWDNVSVNQIPEPSYFTSVVALMALGYAFRQTARRRR